MGRSLWIDVPEQVNQAMGETDFSYEFRDEKALVPPNVKTKVEDRLRQLAEGHTDMTGVDVSVEVIGQGEVPFLFQARIVASVRPTSVAATEKADRPETALTGALEALERQVRDQREKLRETWKEPGAGGASP